MDADIKPDEIRIPKQLLKLTPFGDSMVSENILNEIGQKLKSEGFIDYGDGTTLGRTFRTGYLKGNKIDWVRKGEGVSNLLYFMYLAWDVYALIEKGKGNKPYLFKPLPYYFLVESKEIILIDTIKKRFHEIVNGLKNEGLNQSQTLKLKKSVIKRTQQPWMEKMDEIFERLQPYQKIERYKKQVTNT